MKIMIFGPLRNERIGVCVPALESLRAKFLRVGFGTSQQLPSGRWESGASIKTKRPFAAGKHHLPARACSERPRGQRVPPLVICGGATLYWLPAPPWPLLFVLSTSRVRQRLLPAPGSAKFAGVVHAPGGEPFSQMRPSGRNTTLMQPSRLSQNIR